MATQLTVGEFNAAGEFVDIDLRSLRRAATPKWRARDGEGKGVPAEDIRRLLADLLDRLGWPGGNEAQDNLQFVLSLVSRLLNHQEEHRIGAERALKHIMQEIESIDDPSLVEQFETLSAFVAPVDRIWERS